MGSYSQRNTRKLATLLTFLPWALLSSGFLFCFSPIFASSCWTFSACRSLRTVFPSPTSSRWPWEPLYMDFWDFCFHFASRKNTSQSGGHSWPRLQSGGQVRSRCTCTSTQPGHTRFPLSLFHFSPGFGIERGMHVQLLNGSRLD